MSDINNNNIKLKACIRTICDNYYRDRLAYGYPQAQPTKKPTTDGHSPWAVFQVRPDFWVTTIKAHGLGSHQGTFCAAEQHFSDIELITGERVSNVCNLDSRQDERKLTDRSAGCCPSEVGSSTSAGPDPADRDTPNPRGRLS